MTAKKLGQELDTNSILVQLAKYSIRGQQTDALLFLRKTYSRLQKYLPEVAEEIRPLLAGPNQAVRGVAEPFRAIPVDVDSRIDLLKREDAPVVDPSYLWPEQVMESLQLIITERLQSERLFEVGLAPTKSVLFTGPPGVGKTMAARWLAEKLNRPLLTLDLASVMSSFLGKTGSNLRAVLDYARSGEYVLLLDEFDSIAKRRDDSTDVGELKRLVTVLLQAIDEWPENGMLIAATNHPELLDPAVWRRFDGVVKFPVPSKSDIQQFLQNQFSQIELSEALAEVEPLSIILSGNSYSDIDRLLRLSYRRFVIEDGSIIDKLYTSIYLSGIINKSNKSELANRLRDLGWSERKIASNIHISRDTMRKGNKK